MIPTCMRPPHHSFTLLLATAFFISGAAFIATSLYGQFSEHGIAATANSIAKNAAPSVADLGRLRTMLREYEIDIGTFVYGVGSTSPAAGRRLNQMRNNLHEQWTRYISLPTYPGERELAPLVRTRMAAVDAAIMKMEQALEAKDQAAAAALFETELDPATDALDDVLDKLVAINADTAAQLALAIQHRRRRSEVASLTMTAISALLQFLAAFLAIRAVAVRTRALQARNDELDHFAGRVAHDVLGPLSGLDLSVQLLGESPTPERLEKLAPRMRSAVRRVRQLADGLLAFARSGAQPAPAQTSLTAVLPDLLVELHAEAEEAHIELTAEPLPNVVVACAEGVILSIIGNLVRNAIKYMGERSERKIALRYRVLETRLAIEIEDSGPGIPPELGARIFEPFTRGDVPGTTGAGLGLATVKRLVTSHGGKIEVNSVVGVGSRFALELPCGVVPQPSK